MARRVYEGTFDVWFVPAASGIEDITEPEIDEITDGVDITCFLTKDGFQPNVTRNNVDSAALCDTFDGQLPGSFGSDLTLTFFRDDATVEPAWDLVVHGAAGFIVALPFTGREAPVAGDKAMIWEGAWHIKSPGNTAANTQQTFETSFPAVRLELDATVVANT